MVGLILLMKMYILGHGFVSEPIYVGGLCYYGMVLLVLYVFELGLVEVIVIPQTECFEGVICFVCSEGIILVLEFTYAIAVAVREAIVCCESGELKMILIVLCGYGYFDLVFYDKFLGGEMCDLEFSDVDLVSVLCDVLWVD